MCFVLGGMGGWCGFVHFLIDVCLVDDVACFCGGFFVCFVFLLLFPRYMLAGQCAGFFLTSGMVQQPECRTAGCYL